MDRNSLGYQAMVHRLEVLENQFTQLVKHVYALSFELNKVKNGEGETTTTQEPAPAQRSQVPSQRSTPAKAPENASDAINRLLQSTTR